MNGAFDKPGGGTHAYSSDFLQLQPIISGKRVLDLGCGSGAFLDRAKDFCKEVKGYDNYPDVSKHTNGLGHNADLSQIQDFGLYDWVVSFEVGEHIPKEYEKNFFENLTKHAKEGIIISWAEEEQVGDGHINCRSSYYVEKKLRPYNFLKDNLYTRQLKQYCKNPFLKLNIQVFVKVEIQLKEWVFLGWERK